jgi:hypothetical protein
VRADDDRMLHGAACHGCLLISETSCEARNVLLDRVLLVDTVGPTGASYFCSFDLSSPVGRFFRSSPFGVMASAAVESDNVP